MSALSQLLRDLQAHGIVLTPGASPGNAVRTAAAQASVGE
jgi:hypothetical protein